MPFPAVAPPAIIRLTDRQEAFCQAMACDTGGAEAARRAGYSAKGAKQRGAFLMSQPEIRVRVQQLRANRRCSHQTLLDDAADQVETIITEALEKKSCALALRAIEFRLKLKGAIQDKRITHHYHLDQRHPDADLEDLDCDPQEELDGLGSARPAAVTPPAPAPKLSYAPRIGIVTRDSDLSRLPPEPPAATGPLLASTSLMAPMPRFRVPIAA
jgi:hypothetical protein